MINVLIVAPALQKGGTERQLVTFLENFDRKKLNVSMALVRKKIEYTVPKDCKVFDLCKKGKFDFLFIFRLFFLIKKREFQIINGKLPGVNEYLILICSLLKGKKLLLEIRSSFEYLRRNEKRLLFILQNIKKKYNIICNSKNAKNKMERYLSHKSFIEVIPNGIDVERFAKKEKVTTEENRNILGFVGRINKVKNIEVLILGLSELKSIDNKNKYKLNIIGNVEDREYYNRLNKLIVNTNLSKEIRFRLAVQNVEENYSKFKIFILPSLSEGTPNVLLEAMSCECVCLVSKGANSDKYLSKQFQFNTDDYIELALKIKKIINMSDEEKGIIGRNNREFVKKEYSIKRMLHKYIEIYNTVLAE